MMANGDNIFPHAYMEISGAGVVKGKISFLLLLAYDEKHGNDHRHEDFNGHLGHMLRFGLLQPAVDGSAVSWVLFQVSLDWVD